MKKAEIVPLQITATTARPIIQEIATNTSRIVILDHAKRRMRKRRITPSQVVSCLRKGVVIEGPALDDKGFWRCTMQRLAAGEEVTVVVSFNSRDRVLVITAY
ncbi:MAG: DUF4258 domain-containing protein [Rhodospirillales bacterium]|nr:DUF4258 domain-containing protein [Rhodospirillales bacterium]